MRTNRLGYLLMLVATISACSNEEVASADLQAVDGAIIGSAQFREASGTLTITVNVTVPDAGDSEHGIHIHEIGTCSPDFGAAGGHYNPFDDALGEYAGDLDLRNLVLDSEGQGNFEVTSTRLTLAPGEPGTLFDVDGSSIMLHAEPNDAEGAAGARIACGVIEP